MKDLLVFVVGVLAAGVFVPACIMLWLGLIDELKDRRK
jgi:hypothetical protein